ncbi:MAG TPA: hypothetical protein VFD39_03925 [Trueperaceae bacterium]|nr:hypothetical protein [Trueperaceae bacterium]
MINDLAIGANDDIVIAWSGRFAEADPDDQYVSRWDGAAWSLLGGGLLLGDVYPVEAALALTAAGDPVIAFSQAATPGNSATDLYARRWTGSAWTSLGGKLDVNDAAATQTIDLALDQNGNPVVSWGERFYASSFVKIWNPATVSWQALGGSVSPIESAPPILVRASGELVIAINHTDEMLHLLTYNGVGWLVLGPPLRRSTERFAAGRASLAENDEGEVMVGWAEFGTADSAANVATLTDSGWQYAGAEIVATSPASLSNVRLQLIAGNTPAIAYTHYQPHQNGIFSFDADTIFRYLNQ